jgi:HTH-type transcriptional regulator / antitoxin HigA
MGMSNGVDFLPDWVSPPGSTVLDILDERAKSISDFASDMEMSLPDTQKLLNGSSAITMEIATHLSQILGLPAKFWLSRESQFREGIIRLSKNEEWLEQIPVGDMTKFKWISPARTAREKIGASLEFFGVATVSDWWLRYEGASRLTAFRTSTALESTEGAVLAWLRKGEIEADDIHCERWDPEQLKAMLPTIRTLTREKDPNVFIPELQNICAKCGVAVVIERAPSLCRASGATRFLSGEKALLMLSFRFLSDDHFWFTFFHEVGHLLLHDLGATFLEGERLNSEGEALEEEANQFASNLLVPPEHQISMRALPVDGRKVMRFAKELGIAPGIVVGQLQHLDIFTHKQLNNLKTRYRWCAEE